jgi:diadenosine tetraphosphate (Ap4A) HIT family hydrolase
VLLIVYLRNVMPASGFHPRLQQKEREAAASLSCMTPQRSLGGWGSGLLAASTGVVHFLANGVAQPERSCTMTDCNSLANRANSTRLKNSKIPRQAIRHASRANADTPSLRGGHPAPRRRWDLPVRRHPETRTTGWTADHPGASSLRRFQPFAAAVPFETWLMPRTADPSFGDVSDAALAAFAPVLRDVLAGLGQALGDPDCNLVIQSAPIGDEDRQYFVWHVRIIPRLQTVAGFELGSGMAINSWLPEESASLLRDAVRKSRGI